MKKSKPDYTKFMRKPAPLRTSPSSESDFGGPLPGPIREQDIPWAEIVEEIGPSSLDQERLLQLPIIIDEDHDTRLAALKSRFQAIAAKVGLTSIPTESPEDLHSIGDAPPLPILLLALMLFLLVILEA